MPERPDEPFADHDCVTAELAGAGFSLDGRIMLVFDLPDDGELNLKLSLSVADAKAIDEAVQSAIRRLTEHIRSN